MYKITTLLFCASLLMAQENLSSSTQFENQISYQKKMAEQFLIEKQSEFSNKFLKSVLIEFLPKAVVYAFINETLLDSKMQHLSKKQLSNIGSILNQWLLKPNATEGYRTAEVTLGGVDCDELSSKTMQSNKVNGLYFIGEVVDVTGWLGGYNFQWAWSSGWCAGQVV